jgi:hypothetical protein
VTRNRLAAALFLLLLFAAAGAGIGDLTPDATALYQLPSEHPIAQATDLLNETTYGEDALVVVVHSDGEHPHGMIRSDAIERLESLQLKLEAMPAFREVRSGLNLPIFGERDGVLTAQTPLRPKPTSVDEWSQARRMLTADPFVSSGFLGGEMKTAVIIGWLWSGASDEWLARSAAFALRQEDFRSSDLGVIIQTTLNEARLAVAMGEVSGSADAEIARRLLARAAEDPEVGAQVREWQGLHDALSTAAAAELSSVIAARAVDLEKASLRAAVFGPGLVESRLQTLYQSSLVRAAAALALFAGLVTFGLRRSKAEAAWAAVAAPVALVVLFGLYGLLGVPLHPLSASAAFLAAWLALMLGTGRAEGAGDDPLGLAVWILPFGAGVFALFGSKVGGPATLILLLVPLVTSLAFFLPREQRVLPPNVVPRRWGLGAVILSLVGVVFLVRAGVGLDPSKLVAPSEPIGWAAEILSEDLGTAPPVFLVTDHRSGDPRSLSRPEVIREVSDAELRVKDAAQGAVRSIVGWPEFIINLDRGMGGDGMVPTKQDTVDQFLLMFHRPEDTGALVSADLEVSTSLVALRPGAAPAFIAAVIGGLELEPSQSMAGSGVEMMLASRRAVQRGLVGFAALAILFLGLGWVGREATRPRLAQAAGTLLALVVGLNAAVLVEGVVTPTALLSALASGGLLAPSWSWGDRAALLSLGLGGAAALGPIASPVLALRGLGLVLLCSCLVAWMVRAAVVQSRSTEA